MHAVVFNSSAQTVASHGARKEAVERSPRSRGAVDRNTPTWIMRMARCPELAMRRSMKKSPVYGCGGSCGWLGPPSWSWDDVEKPGNQIPGSFYIVPWPNT